MKYNQVHLLRYTLRKVFANKTLENFITEYIYQATRN